MAPKQYVVRGNDYYRRSRITDFRWDDKSGLMASVLGTKYYTVNIFERDGDISCSCNCPAWTSSDNCKHAVCALMTVKNLLDGSFDPSPMDGGEKEYLLEALLGKPEPEPPPAQRGGLSGYAVVISQKGNSSDIFIEQNRQKAVPYGRSFPADLIELSLPFGLTEKTRALSSLLKKHGGRYPIVLRKGKEEQALQFDESASFETVTELDASGDSVTVKKAFRRPGGDAFDCLVLGDVLVSPSEGTCSIVRDTGGWMFWHDVSNLCYEAAFDMGEEIAEQLDGSFKVPMQMFRTFQFFYPSAESLVPHSLILKKEGREIEPATAALSYRLTIFRRDEGSFTLRADCVCSGAAIAPNGRLFELFVKLPRHSCVPLRTKMRRSVICKAFFEMLKADSQTAAERTVKDSLSDASFRQHEVKRQSRLLLYTGLNAFAEAEGRLFLADSGWIAAPIEKAREVSLYRIPYEVFGDGIFDAMREHNEMTVPAERLGRLLPVLHEKLSMEDIGLFLEGKPVKTSSWEFAFDASASGGIDWFEIRPEIRCNGELIDESTWRAIIAGKGMMEGPDCVQILDPNSQTILSMIRAVADAGGASPDKKEIVRVPRLRLLDWIHLRKSGVRVSLPAEDEAVLERLSNFERIEPLPLPSGLKARLRNYQKDGYSWLCFLYENRLGACLADDMGLGKTLQAISLLGAIKEGAVHHPAKDRPCPHLIVLPPSLLFNWESEMRKFYPGLRAVLYTGADRSIAFDDCDVVLTTYGLVRRDIEILRDIQFDIAIFDEAQAVKNIVAGATGAARQLKAHFKLAMTGTPLENHIGEFYSIVDLVLPGLLGDYESFRPLIKQETSQALELAVRRTRPFVLRRTKEKILKELPPKIETDIYLELTEKQKALYRRTVEEVKRTIDSAFRTKTREQARIIALTAILKLRQLCVAPQILSPDIKEPSPKIQFLIEQLKEVLEEGHSSLVFSQFTTFLDHLEGDLRKHGIGFRRLDGSTQVSKRKNLVEGFQNGKGPSVFLLSLKAGGQGLNLTRASYVFHLDPWWNPAVENQASDRAHRIGQTRKVTITRILMRHTIEEKMMALKKRKLELFRAVVEDGHAAKGLSITKEDFNFLLG